MDTVIWGVGGTWKKLKNYIDDDSVRIVAFIDGGVNQNSIRYKGTMFPVYRPEDFFSANINYDIIAIFSIYDEDILRTAEEFNAGRRCIGLEKVKKTLLTDEYSIIERMQRQLYECHRYVHEGLLLGAKLLSNVNLSKDINGLKDVEFKVHSQWGEDGIIQYLTKKIPMKNKTFIEFGVENYVEANTRYLMEEDNWQGMIMDCDKANIEMIKKEEYYWRYGLDAVCAFITCENINELIKNSGFDKDIGILSIDIDGNDYWVLKEIENIIPRILICEFNPVFGEKEKVTIPYDPDFDRKKAHYSGLFFGASLRAIVHLAGSKGYHFVGTNSNYCNAFFVREDLTKYLPEQIKRPNIELDAKYRISMDEHGKLSYLSFTEARKLIGNMEVYHIESGSYKKINELLF